MLVDRRQAHETILEQTNNTQAFGISRFFFSDLKDLLLKDLKVVPLFIRLMTPNGAVWSLDQRNVIMR